MDWQENSRFKWLKLGPGRPEAQRNLRHCTCGHKNQLGHHTNRERRRKQALDIFIKSATENQLDKHWNGFKGKHRVKFQVERRIELLTD